MPSPISQRWVIADGTAMPPGVTEVQGDSDIASVHWRPRTIAPASFNDSARYEVDVGLDGSVFAPVDVLTQHAGDGITAVGICFRFASAANTYYVVQVYKNVFAPSSVAGHWQLMSVTAGVETIIQEADYTWAAGDVLKLSCVGTTITAYVNGVSVSSVTNSSITTGTRVGAYGYRGVTLDEAQLGAIVAQDIYGFVKPTGATPSIKTPGGFRQLGTPAHTRGDRSQAVAQSIALTPVDIAVTPQVLGITPGGASVALTPATVTVTPQVLGITGAVSLPLTPTTITVTPQTLGVTPAVLLALLPTQITVTPQTLGITAAVSVALTPASITVTPQSLGLTANVDLALAPAQIAVTPQPLGISPGGTSIALTPTTITVEPQELGIAVPTAQSIALFPVEIAVIPQELGIQLAGGSMIPTGGGLRHGRTYAEDRADRRRLDRVRELEEIERVNEEALVLLLLCQ